MIPVVQEWITHASRGHRPRPQLPRKESSHETTNRYGSFADRRASAAHRRCSTHKKLETLGAVLVGAAMGHGARGLFRLRELLGLFPARSRPEPRVPLGR